MAQQRHSRQRDEIIRVLCSTKSHPTAEWVYEEVKKTIPNISLATVYRNLAKLAEEKRIIKLGLGTNMEHFDGNPEPHYHIVCCDCGRVHDIESPPLDELNKWAAERFMGTVYNHSAVFFGKCNECK